MKSAVFLSVMTTPFGMLTFSIRWNPVMTASSGVEYESAWLFWKAVLTKRDGGE